MIHAPLLKQASKQTCLVLTAVVLAQVIMATNRIDSLDPALIRPGRIDRKIEFPLPDTKTKRRIFGIHTGRMTLSDDVNLEEFIMAKVTCPCMRYLRHCLSKVSKVQSMYCIIGE